MGAGASQQPGSEVRYSARSSKGTAAREEGVNSRVRLASLGGGHPSRSIPAVTRHRQVRQNASDVHGATGSAAGTVPAQDVAGG